MDLYTEWTRYKEFRVRVGQFKRAFTFENPTHPITQGWYSYANVINALSGFGDRSGEKSSGGRDIGIQVQGDIHAKARYQCYRKAKTWDSSKSMYEVGLNYYFSRNMQLNLEYARVNDRNIANPDKHNYNFFDAELDFRF